MKGMIRVGRWSNENKHAAAGILDRQTFYLDVEDTYEGIKPIDLVPNLSPQNLASVEIGKDFMLKHGVWPFIRQKPYDIIANPSDMPKSIFISAFKSF